MERSINCLSVFVGIALFFLSLSKLHGAYKVVDARPGLTFNNPVAIVSDPANSGSIYVVERKGVIYQVVELATANRRIFLDISDTVNSSKSELGLLGLAFHPNFSENKFFYVFYTHDVGEKTYDRLSRFQADARGKPDRSTELVLIDQEDEAFNHNGGDLHFGSDGYLYVSLGDEGKGRDKFDNSQLIDKDFFAAIMRIDVDKQKGSFEPNPHPAIVLDADGLAHYSVPSDNPYVGIDSFNKAKVNPDKVRTEFWAVGLRNPWRFSFDAKTGEIYCGDVGQDAIEEINIIVKGGNYGWAWKEGTIDGAKADQLVEGVALIEPIFEYPRASGVSVTGGLVYYGERCPGLVGNYVFADFAFGSIWRLYKEDNTWKSEIIGKSSGISAFGIDPLNGDVLMANHNTGLIQRLVIEE
jgi:glucose/arabinose dehydrogenase